MCFTAYRCTTRNMQQGMNGKRRNFYKVVDAYSRRSPYYPTKYAANRTVRADSPLPPFTNRTRWHSRQMRGGIYVYRTYREAMMNCHYNHRVVITVTAVPEDLIGADGKMACFVKVRVKT